jgi:hypothetical protein
VTSSNIIPFRKKASVNTQHHRLSKSEILCKLSSKYAEKQLNETIARHDTADAPSQFDVEQLAEFSRNAEVTAEDCVQPHDPDPRPSVRHDDHFRLRKTLTASTWRDMTPRLTPRQVPQ